tara:strand:- start:960 stop:1901 length:942 start_codon:yes stop_codon:yes gene_type:complete
MTTTCFVFPGQGCQYYGMGAHVYDNNITFKTIMDQGDAIIHKETGQLFLDTIYQDTPMGHFDDLLLTMPGIVVFECAMVALLKDHGVVPSIVWGNSLGELAAAVASNILSMEVAVRIAITYAQSIVANCEKGKMLAVFSGFDTYKQFEALRACSIAATVYDGYYILSGSIQDIDNAIACLENESIDYLVMPVSFGFHSSYIDGAKDTVEAYLSQQSYNKPSCRYISGTLAASCESLVQNHFWMCMRETARFQNAFYHVLEPGIRFVDVGPAGMVPTFIKYNDPNNVATCFSTVTQNQPNNMDWLDTICASVLS